jgi:hypothetical protein
MVSIAAPRASQEFPLSGKNLKSHGSFLPLTRQIALSLTNE